MPEPKLCKQTLAMWRLQVHRFPWGKARTLKSTTCKWRKSLSNIFPLCVCFRKIKNILDQIVVFQVGDLIITLKSNFVNRRWPHFFCQDKITIFCKWKMIFFVFVNDRQPQLVRKSTLIFIQMEDDLKFPTQGKDLIFLLSKSSLTSTSLT